MWSCRIKLDANFLLGKVGDPLCTWVMKVKRATCFYTAFVQSKAFVQQKPLFKEIELLYNARHRPPGPWIEGRTDRRRSHSSASPQNLQLTEVSVCRLVFTGVGLY